MHHKISAADGLLKSIEKELDTAEIRAHMANAIKDRPLSSEQLESLLVGYTILATKERFFNELFPELEKLLKKHKRKNRLLEKGGRPEKRETKIGIDIAVAHYRKHGKHLSAEQLSRKVSLIDRGEKNDWEDEDGKRPLSASGARNCIQQAKTILGLTNNPQKPLIDLLKGT
jgi:hypothetical protein